MGIFFEKLCVQCINFTKKTYYRLLYYIFAILHAFFMMRNFSKTSKKSVGERESSRSDLKFLYPHQFEKIYLICDGIFIKN